MPDYAACACCQEPTRADRIVLRFDGVCRQCLDWMAREFEDLAADRPPNADPETGERLGRERWISLMKRNRARRRLAEAYVDDWRIWEGVPVAELQERRESLRRERVERGDERRARYRRREKRLEAANGSE